MARYNAVKTKVRSRNKNEVKVVRKYNRVPKHVVIEQAILEDLDDTEDIDNLPLRELYLLDYPLYCAKMKQLSDRRYEDEYWASF